MNDDKLSGLLGNDLALDNQITAAHISRRHGKSNLMKEWANKIAEREAMKSERQAYENLLDHFMDKIVESGAGPDDPSEYGEWVRKRAESLINAKRKAMDKYDTMESLK